MSWISHADHDQPVARNRAIQPLPVRVDIDEVRIAPMKPAISALREWIDRYNVECMRCSD